MDPQATLYDLLSYLADDDREEWRDEIMGTLHGLLGWVQGGGYLPTTEVSEEEHRGFIVPE
jgi:hypothetical protein